MAHNKGNHAPGRVRTVAQKTAVRIKTSHNKIRKLKRMLGLTKSAAAKDFYNQRIIYWSSNTGKKSHKRRGGASYAR